MADHKPECDFLKQIDCTYKGEHYSVRDNGSILRHSIIGKQPRSNDNKWSFGNPNEKTGYMVISSERVHRIVATAFHGEAQSKHHVVDHIDTNKRNNRPENLRWVTKLENILLNPITVKRIESVCGSVESFLAEPSKFKDSFQDPSYSWMRRVSSLEAQVSLERLLAWAKNDNKSKGGSLGEWIFNRSWESRTNETKVEISDRTMAKTKNAVQLNWGTSSEFPCCPQDSYINPIKEYTDNLMPGKVFCRNNIYTALTVMSAVSADVQLLYVLSECKGYLYMKV